MAQPVAVTNTSPVIALAGVGQLHLFDALFERVLVPFEVWGELVDKPGAPEPAELQALRCVGFHPAAPIPPEATLLDPGERAAIALAVATPGAWVLLDEMAARRVAEGLRLPVKGTLGILVEGKRRGLVSQLRPVIERMIDNGCRFAPDLVTMVLSSVGE